jgi:hypothetical protein
VKNNPDFNQGNAQNSTGFPTNYHFIAGTFCEQTNKQNIQLKKKQIKTMTKDTTK